MAQVQMEIDSVRRGMLKEEWAIVLKERGENAIYPFLLANREPILWAENFYIWSNDNYHRLTRNSDRKRRSTFNWVISKQR